MKPLRSKAEAAAQNEAAQRLSAFFGVILGSEEPGVIGSVLADLMSAFLVSHVIKTDAAAEADMRTAIMTEWCEAVWTLVAVKEGRSETKQ
jgi:hypothetical protein